MSGEAALISCESSPIALERSSHGIQEALAPRTHANVIFTTEKRIAEEPDVIERFVRATL